MITKVIIKNDYETAVLTVRSGEMTTLIAPKGFAPIAAELNGKIYDISKQNGGIVLPFDIGAKDSLCFLFSKDGRLYFGSYRAKYDALSRWRLTDFYNTIIKTEPTEREESVVESETATPAEEKEQAAERHGESLEETEVPASKSKTELIEERIQRGEKASFLEDAIAGSIWAKLKEDDEEFYLGIYRSNDGEKALYAIGGARSNPPFENAIFLPSAENEEVGWFVQEI